MSKICIAYYIVFLFVLIFPFYTLFSTESMDNESDRYLLLKTRKAFQEGDYIKASEYIFELHNIRIANYNYYSEEVANSFLNVALIESYNWNYESALKYVATAEKIFYQCTQCSNDVLRKVYSQYGLILRQKGEFKLAGEYLFRAIQILLKAETKDIIDISYHYYDLADCERKLGHMEESYNYYDCSFEILNNAHILNKEVMLDYYVGLALSYWEEGSLDKSIQTNLKGLKEINSDTLKYRYHYGIMLNNLGLNYLDIKEFNQSYSYLLKAIENFENLSSYGVQTAEAYQSMGSYYMKTGSYSEANAYFQKSLYLLASQREVSDSLASPEFHAIGDKLTAVFVLKTKIRNLRLLYAETDKIAYLDEAINSSVLAINLLEALHNEYQNYERKLQIADDEHPIYDEALYLLWKAYTHTGEHQYLEQSFWVSEKSRASMLLSALNELDAKKIGTVPDSVLALENTYKRDIAFLKHSIYGISSQSEVDSVRLQDLNDKLFYKQREYFRFKGELEKEYSQYYTLKYDDTVTDIADIEKLISGNTSLLQYNLTDSLIYIFCISRGQVHYVREEIDDAFKDILTQYLNGFHRFDFSRQSGFDYSWFSELSYALYQKLIKPVEPFINGHRLVIIPDGALAHLPFETLISELPNGTSSGYFKNLHYLLRDYDISYSYSSSYLKLVSKNKNRLRNKEVLAFAPEYEANYQDYVNKNKPDNKPLLRKNLHPIPGAIEEVDMIGELINTHKYVGADATETNFLNTVSDYDILHLSMHTLIDNVNPLYSKLVFTLDTSNLNDGLLHTYEVFGLDLQAQLVVLSACSTGDGVLSKGEGVMSMARGFAYAGTPSLLMTMWEVEDRSGTLLMKNFYENLLAGKPKDRALREAKLAFIDEALPENSHPFFWSSYVMLGNTEKLFINHTRLYLISSLVFMLLIGLLVGNYRKR